MSILVFLAISEAAGKLLSTEAAAVGWVHDAYSYLKVIGATAGSKALLKAAGVVVDDGVLTNSDTEAFLAGAAKVRVWSSDQMYE